MNFLRIAEGLDVAPALAELARQPEYWLALDTDGTRIILLLGGGDARLLEAELARSLAADRPSTRDPRRRPWR